MKRAVFLFLSLVLAVSLAAPASASEVELPIIMYHHLLRDSSRWGDYTISPECFEADLKYLKERGYESVSVRELISWANGSGTLPEKPVMLTFDDGQESFIAYALPLLEKYDMCAVVAVVGRYADIYTETEDHNINYSHISWPALGELERTGRVELAGHSYDMHTIGARRGCRIMPGESAADYCAAFTKDLRKLEERFREYTSGVPAVFAYPFGMYCRESQQLLRERGYEAVFTCSEKVNRLTGDPQELYELCRFNRASRYDRAAFFKRAGIT